MSLVEHLEKLRHFHTVTHYRSINEAARSTGMSQAGLSKSIVNLENVLGVKLFVRSLAGLTLTKEGEILLKTTRTILNEVTEVELSLRSAKIADLPEMVKIGMYDSIAVYFFPHLARYIKAIYKNIELELVVDRSPLLASRIENGTLDLAIGVSLKKKSSKAAFYLLFEDHYSFYISPEAMDEAANLPLIFYPDASDEEGISNQEHLSKLAKTHTFHRAYNFETIKTLAALGLGVGVLPTQVASPLVRQKQLVAVKIQNMANLFGKHTIGFLASSRFSKKHPEFVKDIYRLGSRWTMT
jgi:LysR family hydrogen peroxide-inducible transcriptional activator